ncbi:dihydrolipoamide acetyltransferase family protein [Paenibacillus aestuarii]|uniref:Dihydrolipoamide acetyltransferase component of pyruvate dehydrogenase complex n=1 Tax=Paenibacillus aestuarii TaxID=516965 RepID=A0ABW0K5E9_9BACL|nr:dihydrolipoamide acetyltransferase family protein [Paenibacillus aestuarii]
MASKEQGTEVTVPHLAESLVSATVGKWLKQPGDAVREYDVLCELMTDKVNVEMPSPLDGIVVQLLVQEGETASVGSPICIIRAAGEHEEAGATQGALGGAAQALGGTVQAAGGAVRPEEAAAPAEPEPSGVHSARFSPAVLKLAKVHGVELQRVKGTGLGGRITRKDILLYVKNRASSATVQAPERSEAAAGPSVVAEPGPAPARASTAQGGLAKPQTPPAQLPAQPPTSETEQTRMPITPLRRLIASRMQQSLTEIPHAWLTVEADVSGLVALRTKWKERFEREEGVPLTYTPFVLKAIINAIKDYPILNASWAHDHIVIYKPIHLSIAIGSDSSVVTPVIRHAEHKTIAGLAIELHDLIKRTKAGKLTPADMQGGTFTFNNTGAFGSVSSYPIINYPQAAIITMESIVRKPVVVTNDAIAIRSMVNLCLSLDHRVLDGVICGQFLQRVKSNLEHVNTDTVIY